MEKTSNLTERLTKHLFSIFFLMSAVGLAVIGLTVLPLIGLVLVVPALIVSAFTYRVHLDDRRQTTERE